MLSVFYCISGKRMTSHSFNCFSIAWGQGLGTIGYFSSEDLPHDKDAVKKIFFGGLQFFDPNFKKHVAISLKPC